MEAGRVVWMLLTDPRRFGKVLYFNPEAFEFRLGIDVWDMLETFVGLEDAGLLKLTAPSDFLLFYDYELAKVRITNFLGLKPYDALLTEFKKVWLMGRVLKVEPPRQLGIRLPDYADKCKNFNTQLNKLFKLMETKALVSREVYNRVATSVVKETLDVAREVRELVNELNGLVAETVRILNRFKDGRKNIEETSSKLGVKFEENEELLEIYRNAEQDLLDTLLNIKARVTDLLPVWEQAAAAYDKMKAEFQMAGQEFFQVIETLRQVNSNFTAITQRA